MAPYIWHEKISSIDKVMACCLKAPSHYLNQCNSSSERSRDIHLRAISQKIPPPSITKIRLKTIYQNFHLNLKIRLKIIYLNFHLDLPGVNEFSTRLTLRTLHTTSGKKAIHRSQNTYEHTLEQVHISLSYIGNDVTSNTPRATCSSMTRLILYVCAQPKRDGVIL